MLRQRFLFRYTALLTAVFLAAELPLTPPVLASEQGTSAKISESFSLTNFQIDSSLASVTEHWTGTSDQTVIVIQDAHEIPEAQKNIQNLIEYFTQKHGISLVAVEGADSPLDPQFLKSYPDTKKLQATLQHYLNAAELTGPTAAAILDSSKTVYVGVDERDEFEKGILAYQAAMQNEAIILEQLTDWRKGLNQEKLKYYSSELLKLDRLLESFHQGKTHLINVLQNLSRIQMPQKGSTLEIIAHHLQDDLVRTKPEVMKVIQQTEQFFKKNSKIKDQQTFYQKKQAFQNSNLSIVDMALFLTELGQRHRINHKFSAELQQRIKEQKDLQNLQGQEFMKEFEEYANSVVEHLVQKGNASEIALRKDLKQQTHNLNLLERLARLEISHTEWDQIKAALNNSTNDLGKRLQAHHEALLHQIDFYRIAEKRDHILFDGLQTSLKKYATDKALFVAGGFHTQGMTENLKRAGISYVLVTPKIGNIPANTKEVYRRHMQSDVSWKHHFEIKNGRINIYEAFMRGVRDKLVQSPEDRVPSTNSVLGTRYSVLKQWRDSLIRDLANQNKINQAQNYTRFIDELNTHEDSDLIGLPEQAQEFISKIRELETRRELSVSNVVKLLTNLPLRATSPTFEVSPFVLSPDASRLPYISVVVPQPKKRVIAPVLVQKEVRSELRINKAKTIFQIALLAIAMSGVVGCSTVSSQHKATFYPNTRIQTTVDHSSYEASLVERVRREQAAARAVVNADQELTPSTSETIQPKFYPSGVANQMNTTFANEMLAKVNPPAKETSLTSLENPEPLTEALRPSTNKVTEVTATVTSPIAPATEALQISEVKRFTPSMEQATLDWTKRMIARATENTSTTVATTAPDPEKIPEPENKEPAPSSAEDLTLVASGPPVPIPSDLIDIQEPGSDPLAQTSSPETLTTANPVVALTESDPQILTQGTNLLVSGETDLGSSITNRFDETTGRDTNSLSKAELQKLKTDKTPQPIFEDRNLDEAFSAWATDRSKTRIFFDQDPRLSEAIDVFLKNLSTWPSDQPISLTGITITPTNLVNQVEWLHQIEKDFALYQRYESYYRATNRDQMAADVLTRVHNVYNRLSILKGLASNGNSKKITFPDLLQNLQGSIQFDLGWLTNKVPASVVAGKISSRSNVNSRFAKTESKHSNTNSGSQSPFFENHELNEAFSVWVHNMQGTVSIEQHSKIFDAINFFLNQIETWPKDQPISLIGGMIIPSSDLVNSSAIVQLRKRVEKVEKLRQDFRLKLPNDAERLDQEAAQKVERVLTKLRENTRTFEVPLTDVLQSLESSLMNDINWLGPKESFWDEWGGWLLPLGGFGAFILGLRWLGNTKFFRSRLEGLRAMRQETNVSRTESQAPAQSADPTSNAAQQPPVQSAKSEVRRAKIAHPNVATVNQPTTESIASAVVIVVNRLEGQAVSSGELQQSASILVADPKTFIAQLISKIQSTQNQKVITVLSQLIKSLSSNQLKGNFGIVFNFDQGESVSAEHALEMFMAQSGIDGKLYALVPAGNQIKPEGVEVVQVGRFDSYEPSHVLTNQQAVPALGKATRNPHLFPVASVGLEKLEIDPSLMAVVDKVIQMVIGLHLSSLVKNADEITASNTKLKETLLQRLNLIGLPHAIQISNNQLTVDVGMILQSKLQAEITQNRLVRRSA